jgi:flagellar biogenesis protein FliO
MRLLCALAGVLALIIGVGWIVLRSSLPQVDGMR